MPISIHEVSDPEDPAVIQAARLMEQTFADPNIILSPEKLAAAVGQREPDRSSHFLAARHGERTIGLVIFHFVPPSMCGFSEYLVVHRDFRNQGVGRRLVEARKAVLDRRAREEGGSGARGVFVEVENPHRTPAEFLERERVTALDAWVRLHVFRRLGFRRVDVNYVQPPLGPGLEPVDYLDLLFCPWDPLALKEQHIPFPWVLESVHPVWRGWTPDHYDRFVENFQNQVRSPRVALLPLAEPEPEARSMG